MSEPEKLFDNAKKSLESNPTGGQVEQSVVLHILKKLGYKEANSSTKHNLYHGTEITQRRFGDYDKD